MTSLDHYLLFGLIVAMFAAYIVYQMIKGILAAIGRSWFSMSNQYPIITPPQGIPTLQQASNNNSETDGLTKVLLLVVIVVALLNLFKGVDFTKFTKPVNKAPQDTQVVKAKFTENRYNSDPKNISPGENPVKEEQNAQINTDPSVSDESNHIPVYYLQISCSNSLEGANKKAISFQVKYDVYIGYKGTNLPYKILIGNFKDKVTANHFKAKNLDLPRNSFSISSDDLDNFPGQF